VRSGDTSQAVRVDYATSDLAGLNNCSTINSLASERCDYTTAVGTLRFAAGQTQRTFNIFITNDAYVEGLETAQLTLSNPQGAVLGTQSSATFTINDNDSVSSALNPIDVAETFLRHQYIDFLYREPDPTGRANWLALLQGCPNSGFGQSNPGCDRVKISAGFYFSEEFGDRGYWVIRFYEAVLGRRPTYREFIRDLQAIGGQMTPAQSENSKQQYLAEFITRPEFTGIYGGLMGSSQAAAFVARLEQTAGLTLASRNTLINQMQSGQRTAAETLRSFVESPEVFNEFLDSGLVEIMYFGYLRRAPDQDGFERWLQTLNQSNDFRTLIFGFLYSPEYRQRFGTP
jgi:hypothetical protein